MSDLRQQGITALKAGDKKAAQQFLGRAVQANPQDEQAWLWLSAAVEGDERRQACLERVLGINPDNEAAQRGLAAIQQRQAQQSPEPAPTSPPALLPATPITAPPEYAREEDLLRAEEQQVHSPWLAIWTRPRETIRRIVTSDPTRYVIVLAMLSGFGRYLNVASSRDAGDILPVVWLFLLGMVLGPLGGIASVYFKGFYFRWVGSWFGGQASGEEVRAAFAWSAVPRIFAQLMWIPELLLVGGEMFTSATPTMDANPLLALLLLGCLGIELVLVLWSFVLQVLCLGEVHRFSAWKALATLLVGWFAFLAVIFSLAACVLLGTSL